MRVDFDNPGKYAPYLSPALRAQTDSMLRTSERLVQPLYDYQTYASAGQSSLTFFQIPIGQSSKTLSDTNMTNAGALPQGQFFLVTGVEIPFWSGAEVDATTNGQLEDVNAFAKAGNYTLTIGTKPYGQEAPLGVFPAQFGVTGTESAATTASTTTIVRDQARVCGAPYSLLAAPLLLTSNVNFNVTLQWPTAVALPSGVNGRVGVRFRGLMYRLAQ